ncbi:WD repeat-containing protein 75 [Salvia hispanica]|uniref:WD repeat-containing protein 75 n=1 Tax=Salvia hispanica TaxID=49212 RepID=UPI002009DA09|nr:WD repeat-containing protein 75 [Salvia hispanica]
MFTGGKSFVSSPPAFSNDAKRLLVCTGNTVSVFSTSTGLQTCELEGHEAQVTSVIVVPATNPASKVLCYCWTSSLDGKINYWDFAAPELMRTIDIRFRIHSMVIPSLLCQRTDSTGKLPVPDLYAYISTEDMKQEGKPSSFAIQKCNLTKSRLVCGVTLAETRKPRYVTISPSGKYIGTCEKRKLRIWEIPAKDSEHVGYKKVSLHHTRPITTMAFHPNERVVAAGDVTGRILLWRGVGRETFSNSKSSNGRMNMDREDMPGVRDTDDADSCTTWHWHSSEVNMLFFSSDGAYLYSGGKEGVLVVWQLDTGKKKFLPRIGSPLLYFINSPDPTLSSISCADNQIQLLRMPSMEILRSISGIKLLCSHMDMYEGFGSAVVFNPTAGLIAVPAENYRVQLYSLFDDREISQVQICERNHQPGDEITVKVNLVALSRDGSTMCTVETRLPEEGIGSLVTLKFWACGSQKKQISLSTVIYEPHRDAEISCIAFRPTGNMAVSSSHGGDFKVWVHRHELTPKDETVQRSGWTCHAVGSYKKKPMSTAAFSSDGSVLAVAADKVITLWDPDRNTLLAVIGDSLEPITNLTFVGKSEYLVSASASRGSKISNPQLTVWSMSKLCAAWSYRLDIEAITCSMDDCTFAVLARSKPNGSADKSSKHAEDVILLFNAEKAVPLSVWFVSEAQGGGLSFVSSDEDKVSGTLGTDEVLAYINGAREYVLLNPHSEQDISRQRDFTNLDETDTHGYASVYGELPEFSLKADQTAFPSMPSGKTWKGIFSGPSHALPPLPKLCSDFLESLLERRSGVVE